jgi:hypothetical protein
VSDRDHDPRDSLSRRFPLCVQAGTGVALLLFTLASQPCFVCVHTREEVAADRMLEIGKALELYRLEHGQHPRNLRALTEPCFGENGGYYPDVPLDPWKQRFVYYRNRDGDPPYVLYSRGRDGVRGTDDDVRLEGLRGDD